MRDNLLTAGFPDLCILQLDIKWEKNPHGDTEQIENQSKTVKHLSSRGKNPGLLTPSPVASQIRLVFFILTAHFIPDISKVRDF